MLTSEEIREYRQRNKQCELWPRLPVEERRKLGGNRNAAGQHLHHIALGSNKRDNELTNLIHLDADVHHNWVHKYPADGFVLCCWVKQGKGELDWEVMSRIMRKQLPGYLETDYFADRINFDWIQEKREELIHGVQQSDLAG